MTQTHSRPEGALQRRQLLCVAAGALAVPGAQAQADAPPASIWPARPVRLVVAYPPGGTADTVARAMAQRLAVRLGVPVAVENKAGASGTLAVDQVAKSAADGYTLVFTALSPLTLVPHLGKVPYDPLRDLVAVASVMVSPVLIAATPATDVADFKALLAKARARPGKLRWATSGTASLGHVVLEQIRAATQADFTHVPYKGGGQQITDALGGEFEVLSVNASALVLEHVRAGKLRVLAVGSAQRLQSLPAAPTLAELGHPQANLGSRFGVLAPAGTTVSAVDRLNMEINWTLALPEIRERLLAAECAPLRSTSAEFARMIAAESEGMARIVQEAHLKAAVYNSRSQTREEA